MCWNFAYNSRLKKTLLSLNFLELFLSTEGLFTEVWNSVLHGRGPAASVSEFYFARPVVQWSESLATDPEFDYRRYQIFWEVVGLERGPLSFVRISEELLEWKSSGSGSRKPRLTAVGIRCAGLCHFLTLALWIIFNADHSGRAV
jgi:hypothetical protein